MVEMKFFFFLPHGSFWHKENAEIKACCWTFCVENALDLGHKSETSFVSTAVAVILDPKMLCTDRIRRL